MTTKSTKQGWAMTSTNNWASPSHRGYTGAIAYAAGVGYTLTITGSGAPAPAVYPTLRLAKVTYSKFLRTK